MTNVPERKGTPAVLAAVIAALSLGGATGALSQTAPKLADPEVLVPPAANPRPPAPTKKAKAAAAKKASHPVGTNGLVAAPPDPIEEPLVGSSPAMDDPDVLPMTPISPRKTKPKAPF